MLPLTKNIYIKLKYSPIISNYQNNGTSQYRS